MVRWQQSVLRGYLNLERVCLEAQGKWSVEDIAVDERSSVPKVLKAGLYLLTVIVFVAGFAVWHVWFSETSVEKVFNTIFFVDTVGACTITSFPFFGPMHYALGNFENDSMTHQRLGWLMEDRGTRQCVSLAFVCLAIYTVADLLEFYSSFPELWQQWLYVPLVVGNIGLYYGGMLLIISTMRVLLVRLFAIEAQVDHALDITEPTMSHQNFRNSRLYQRCDASPERSGDSVTSRSHVEHGDGITDERRALTTSQPSNTSSVDTSIQPGPNSANIDNGSTAFSPNQQALEWAQRYRTIRRDTHQVSAQFGLPMMAGLFLFLCETTSMIGMLWEEIGDTLGAKGATSLVLAFVTNAIMICAAFYSMAYLVTECSHHIGPKLAILAVRCHDEAPRYQVLASAFLHAPIKIHVGVFEVAPEYACAIGLWFLGLFLVVFGLKMPGAE